MSAGERPLYLGVALVSMAALILEVALTRLFSFTVWYHFAYVTISVALLGYGSSGAILAMFPRLIGRAPRRRLAAYAIGCGGAIVLALVVFATVPFSAFRMAREPARQIPYMLAYYAAATVPFFLAGLCLAVALQTLAPRAEQLYGCDLLGAGLGCLVVVLVIAVVGTPGAVVVAAVLVSVAGVCFAAADGRDRLGVAPLAGANGRGGAVMALLAAAGVGVAGAGALAVLEFTPAAEKSLAPFLLNPVGIRRYHSEWSPIFRTDVFGWTDEDVSRGGGYAGWGGSVAWRAVARTRAPRLRFITHDGDAGAPIYNFDGDLATLEVFEHLVLKAPYLLVERPDVLVIGVGGGADVVNAIANHARHVTGIELDPVTYRQVKVDHAAFAGQIYDRPDVTMLVGEGRSTLRRSAATYDLIQLSEVDTYAALSAGAYVMSESYLYTTDAIGDYLDHLTPNGVLSIVVVDLAGGAAGYPRHTMRLVAEYAEALHRRGIDAAERHIAVMASSEPWPVVAVLLKPTPFTSDEVSRVRDFAMRMGFPLWALPGESFETPHATFLHLPAAERAAYLARQELVVTPTTDDSPFFFNFYRWRDLGRSMQEVDPGRTLATAQLVLVAILVVSIVSSVLLIVVPLVAFRRRSLATPGASGVIAFFLAVGLGFMLIEISLVQRLVLFLGYPTYALTVVLCSLLVSAGVGSMVSGRMRGAPERRLLPLLAALAVLVVLDAAGPWLMRAGFDRPLPVRVALAGFALAPLGLVAGMFLPAGIGLVRRIDATLIPWAWGMNACASVIGTAFAVMLAISFGFRAVAYVALAIYALGVAALWAAVRRQGGLHEHP